VGSEEEEGSAGLPSVLPPDREGRWLQVRMSLLSFTCLADPFVHPLLQMRFPPYKCNAYSFQALYAV
jgi:hypothetical protein